MFCFLVMSAIGLVGAPEGSEAAELPLLTAENGRFLTDQKGVPFLVVGDTAWSLIAQLKEPEIDRYLADRATKGFNSVIVNLIEHRFSTSPPRTRAGLAPFAQPGDFSTANADYFAFAHKVIKKANDQGIVVWLCPSYLGFGGGEDGFFREMKAGGAARLRAYGRFVGERFKDLPNIVWLMGGDYTPTDADQWTVTDVAAGIREVDSAHPMTAHGSPSSTAVSAFGEQAWLTVNTVYTYEKTPFQRMLSVYHRRPNRPFVLIEAVYEGEHDSKPELIRRQAYWAMLSGACGQFFGNNPIWHFDGPGLFPATATWQEAMGGTGSRDMIRLRKVFRTLPWHRLIPEEDHTVVTDGYGSGEATALTALSTDQKLSVTYIPSTGSERRALTVRMDRFAGPVTARWYNPADGRYAAIAEQSVALRDVHDLRTPGDNGTKTNDWLLILEVR